ncbi:MAG: alpha-glucosidase [Clostridiales bacterium]|jgi:oligo-1,6-glucosidase|nr:alpha-glucosidase [Clostridiales bacterium]
MKDWIKKAVIYQIYPRSFKDSNGDGVGDLVGITEKLPYLSNLGVDVIWLSPVYKSPNEDNGYDISDYEDIMEEFGTMADFDKMLETAHSLGLKIMMDLVVNHTSDEHKWFIESKNKNPKYSDYYFWSDSTNNWGAFFGGSVWEYSPERKQYYFHAFAPKQPDLNWDNPCVRKEVFDMMTYWCEKGVDGFRMDVISLISKPEKFCDGVPDSSRYSHVADHIANGRHVHEYLREMNKNVLSKYDIITVGETACVTIPEALYYAGFDTNELNMVFQFDNMGLDREKIGKWAKKRPQLTELKKILSKWQEELYGKAWNSLYWNNHDQPRVVSRFGNDDKYRIESAKMLAVCLHFMQGSPYIYQGEELGMTNAKFDDIKDYRDIETLNAYKELVGKGIMSQEDMLERLAFSSRDNARTPMQWTSGENAGFTNGTPWIKINENYTEINAENQVNDSNSIFNFYKKIIGLRKKYEIITELKYELLLPNSEELYIYKRLYKNSELLVICNFTSETQEFSLPEYFDSTEIVISNYNRAAYSNTLAPYEAVVLGVNLQ